MLNFLFNLFYITLYFFIAGLVGYYSYEKHGTLSIFNNACFFLLGMLLFSTLSHLSSRKDKASSCKTPKPKLKTEKEK